MIQFYTKMKRLNKYRQENLEPKRMNFALKKLQELKLEITLQTDNQINFKYKYSTIQYFPYSGWHSGKNIVDGRGWKKLHKQLLT